MSRKNEFTEAVDKAIGVKVHELRLIMGLSRQQLSKKIKVTHQQLQKYEKGHNRISCGRMAAIANALGKPVSYFFEEAEAPEIPTAGQRMCIEVSRNFMRIKDPMQQNAISILTRTLAN